jgi:hypothetical protein
VSKHDDEHPDQPMPAQDLPRRVWVLDHETKGTGAEMVPLDKARPAGGTTRGPTIVREPQPLPPKPPEPRKPPRFKIVDVMTRQVLAENVDTRTAVDVLEGIRSVVDVNVYAWRDTEGDWLQLSQHDRGTLWDLRGRHPAGA